MKLRGVIRKILRKENRATPSFDYTIQHPVPELTRVIEAKRYSTLDSKVIAQGPWTSMFLPQYAWLLQTQKRNYFAIWGTPFMGGLQLEVVTPERARQIYESLNWQEVAYEQAFPGVQVTDA